MARLDGRVAIVTGAGRGLGRCHALALAAEGAAIVVNDLGTHLNGEKADAEFADNVVAEIRARGGRAVASPHDIADWRQAEDLIRLAIDVFGDLHILVNNAGILRDRTLSNMDEQDWDAVIRVHLKGHAAPTRHALAYWKQCAKAGAITDRSVVHTTSVAGFSGNFGQANYASAKLALLALSRVVTLEAARYGVRSNCVSPSGRTRLTIGVDELPLKPPQPYDFENLDPANVSPLIVWLASPNCPATAQVFHLVGSRLVVSRLPPIVHVVDDGHRWTLEALDEQLPPLLQVPDHLDDWFGYHVETNRARA